MEFTDFKGSTITIGKPVDWTDEQCQSVRATTGVDSNGFPYFLVAVKPTDEDLEMLNNGGLVMLKVVGQVFQPVAMFVVDHTNTI